MLGIKQEQHHGVRTRGAEGGQVDGSDCHSQGFKQEDRIQARDAGRQCDEDEHCPGHARVDVPEKHVESEGQKDKECLTQQLGDDAQADKPGVRENVSGRGHRVPHDVRFGFQKSLGEAAEDGKEQVKNTGDSREALGRGDAAGAAACAGLMVRCRGWRADIGDSVKHGYHELISPPWARACPRLGEWSGFSIPPRDPRRLRAGNP